ncbi:MAG: prephenate dehydrogenase/arogenate dehydrogenase family protein [Acidobacteriota bacterium]
MADFERLSHVRERIAAVDRALLELLRQRMDLAAEVGRIKAADGLPVVVRDVEDRILGRARQHAEVCGVSEEVMEAIFTAIIRSSVERQHRVGVALRAARGARVLIVGGAGGMGSWLRGFLTLVGHHVEVLDTAWSALPAAPGRHSSLDAVKDLNRFDFIVVAVPLAATPAVIDAIANRKPAGAVVEIASIKAHLEPALARSAAAGVWVSSLHPMFGPGKSPYEPLTFVLACQRGEEGERARLEALLQHPYTDLITIPFAHHDRLMGWLLGLAHLNGMLFGAALTRSRLTPRELEACASTTFQRQAATSLSVLSEDPDLYLDIQRLNPHRDEVYQSTRDALAELVGLITSADRDGFRQALAAARRALAGES